MKIYIAAVLVLEVVLFVARVSAGCDVDGDCSPTQCCKEAWTFNVVSKRGIFDSLSFDDLNADRGRCVDYIQENGSCHHLWVSDCGCAPGLECKYYEDEDYVEDGWYGGRRKRLIAYSPGSSICERPRTEPAAEQ